jgi:DNA helicase IV
MAVGDDWQSIYAFAGSNISLFTHFIDEMGDGILLKINNTYRNAQEIIDIAGKFIQKNAAQIQKSLVSNKHIQGPIFVYVYSDDYEKNETKGVQGVMEERGKLLESVLDKIVQHGGLKKSVLLLGRYGFDAEQLGKTSFFTYNSESKIIKSKKHPNLNLDFLTVHSSKGLGYDNVILINAIDAVFGFPSQIEDDPIMNLVVHGDRNFAFAEERRLFYVALTRTKERVFILAPKKKPSQFVKEIIEDNPKSITIRGEFAAKAEGAKGNRHTCPICGYPLQLRINPHYQMKLYSCTNEPEICDFLTNDLHGGSKPIHRCSKCTDGYMIVNKNKEEDNYFFGCTNFKHDRTGCNNTERI